MAKSGVIVMILLLCFGIASVIPVQGDAASEIAALFALQAAIADTNPMQWNASLYHCQWQGVSCINGVVTALQLPGQGLKGQIPKGTLGNLRHLTVLNLGLNLLSGLLPDDLTNCHQLTYLIMRHNLLLGALPEDFSVWPNLRVIDLSYNFFSGLIPPSIANLINLVGLLLQNNSFTGPLPQMNAAALLDFSVANNCLNGSVTGDLVAKFSTKSLSGNGFCGPPLGMPCLTNPVPPLSLPLLVSSRLFLKRFALPPFSPSPSSISFSSQFSLPPEVASSGKDPHVHTKKLRFGLIIFIGIGDTIVGVLFLLLVFYFCRKLRKRRHGQEVKMGNSYDTSMTNKLESSDMYDSKQVSSEGAVRRFDFNDLDGASTEVLENGSMGCSYRAALDDGSMVVVKRLKGANTVDEELRLQLQTLYRLRHPNLLTPRAYYLINDEKLLVYDYFSLGSLFTLLHGDREVGHSPLDWVARFQIVLGAARGIAYLHDLGGKAGLIHGNIKSSNVLIKYKYEVCVSDFGLAHLLNPSVENIGYRAPETVKTRILTEKADVYSFGVLLLEVLTGKAPMPTSPNDKGLDLPRWVQSVADKKWTTDVFDPALMMYQNIEDEMVQMLQIAMGCISTTPGKRPRMNQVVMMLEDIRPNVSFDNSKEMSADMDSFAFYTPTVSPSNFSI